MRVLAGLLILALVALALAMSNRVQPMLVDQHSPGGWAFNNAALERGPQDDPPPQLYELCPFDPPTDKQEIHQA